ncbi:MAG: EF-hand domain-containing protein [Alphaproteobacteria bacterium]|nr:EF-hand domain-containing protein [Alphaproteobacteria bacterium]
MMKFFIAASALLVVAAAPALAQDRTNRGMMRYDANGDGFVDRAEWAAGQEARFRQLDTDKDGKLSQDELFARTPAAGRNVVPDDRQVQRQARFFRELDTDKDGFVSKAEFLAQTERNFARCDLDKDGRINTAECRQALQRRPADKARLER